METPASKSPRPVQGHSGPAAQVARALRGLKDARVLALELPPGHEDLEPELLKGLELLLAMMERRGAEIHEEQVRQIADLLTEHVALPEAAVLEGQMRANVIRQLIAEGSWLSAGQIAEQGGYSRSNPAEPASRWKREGRIFAVPFKGQDLYGAFQFDPTMQPRPVIGHVLKVFKDKKDPWKIAAWFASVNGWLGGDRPQDRLAEPALVLEAAEREVVGFDG